MVKFVPDIGKEMVKFGPSILFKKPPFEVSELFLTIDTSTWHLKKNIIAIDCLTKQNIDQYSGCGRHSCMCVLQL